VHGGHEAAAGDLGFFAGGEALELIEMVGEQGDGLEADAGEGEFGEELFVVLKVVALEELVELFGGLELGEDLAEGFAGAEEFFGQGFGGEHLLLL
jgi:hypothetical protein